MSEIPGGSAEISRPLCRMTVVDALGPVDLCLSCRNASVALVGSASDPVGHKLPAVERAWASFRLSIMKALTGPAMPRSLAPLSFNEDSQLTRPCGASGARVTLFACLAPIAPIRVECTASPALWQELDAATFTTVSRLAPNGGLRRWRLRHERYSDWQPWS